MSTLRISLTTPAGWVDVPQEPDEDGFAPPVLVPDPWPADFGFRPSIVVAASPAYAEEPSVQAAGSEAVAVALSMEESRVLAYDLWPLPDGGEARRLLFAHLAGETAVCVTQYVAVHAGRSITVTASADTDRWERVQPAVDQALAGLRFEEVAS